MIYYLELMIHLISGNGTNIFAGQRENQAKRTTNKMVDKLAENMDKSGAIQV